MCDLIREKLVMRGDSHFTLNVACTKEAIGEQQRTAASWASLFSRMEKKSIALAQSFKERMAEVGYGHVGICRNDKGEVEPKLGITGERGIEAVLLGDLHAPFDRGVVKGVCDTLGMELKEVERDDA